MGMGTAPRQSAMRLFKNCEVIIFSLLSTNERSGLMDEKRVAGEGGRGRPTAVLIM